MRLMMISDSGLLFWATLYISAGALPQTALDDVLKNPLQSAWESDAPFPFRSTPSVSRLVLQPYHILNATTPLSVYTLYNTIRHCILRVKKL